jgi:thioredoxin 1
MKESQQRKTGTGGKHVITVTDANLTEVTGRNKLVLIDFWNERCEYCRDLEPIIERLAADYLGRAAFGKLNVDENRATRIRFKVQAFPTLVLVKNGKEVERIIGYVPREQIEAALKKQLNTPDESEKANNVCSRTSGCKII